MSTQPPITEVKVLAEKYAKPLEIPKDITNIRPFLEGVIACGATGAKRDRMTKNPYKYGGSHHNDWERGWSYLLEQNTEPKFLKRVEAA
ncbi:hypothetical protein [Gracilimonas sediminicola]|uniref:Uncharacterized protein n=1 Tax=Gracilimonas sediminicola TaxID=2952158 RepID=A0A9X2L0J0_9BACT|nr:hypothetical protein [Gracilimonas sediminicola]MCP9290029.1 hypothetical protein [Gracilimonas sediminicola]